MKNLQNHKNQLSEKLDELFDAKENSDFESISNLRNEISDIKNEIKKIENEIEYNNSLNPFEYKFL